MAYCSLGTLEICREFCNGKPGHLYKKAVLFWE
jgi:hypothetical protein